MVANSIDTDVLIVGAGPVGLFLANECARRGLRFRIVESHPGLSEHSKALAVFPRTLEILDMAGLVEPFLSRANPVSSVAFAPGGRVLARMPFSPAESRYPFIAMLPQNVTERLLADHLAAVGGMVEYETSLISAVDEGEHVTATLSRRGRPLTVRASYVVGCDGAHSAVRHLLALPFEGREYRESFMLADIETDALDAGELALCPSAAGPLAVFPMSRTRARIVAIVGEREGDAPSIELVRRLVAERAMAGLTVRELHWSSYFSVHHRQVSQMRVGRFFIAGDAAHIHSPFGGQGMNAGLHDAWNLAWKLDLVVRGRAGEALLDSYSAERVPAVRDIIETTHRLTRAMGTRSRLARALRNAFIPAVSQLPPFRHAFVTKLSGLGIDYRRSPIVHGRGERCFDESMRGGSGIVSRYLLLGPRDTDDVTREALQRFASAWRDLVELRFVSRKDTVLVRPDGYVACAVRPGDVATELEEPTTHLERQVRHTASAVAAPLVLDPAFVADDDRRSAHSAWC